MKPAEDLAVALAQLAWETSSLCVQLQDKGVELPQELLTAIGVAARSLKENGFEELVDRLEAEHKQVWG